MADLEEGKRNPEKSKKVKRKRKKEQEHRIEALRLFLFQFVSTKEVHLKRYDSCRSINCRSSVIIPKF